MSLSAAELKILIKAKIIELVPPTKPDSTDFDKFCEALADSIVTHVTEKLSVQIPVGTVIVAVAGGVGTPNPTPITCTVA